MLFAVALAWFSLSLDKTFHPQDEGYPLDRSAQVAAGAVPHRDFVDVYGPATFLLTGGVMRVLGEDVLGVHRFLAVVKAAAVVAGYGLMRTVAPRSFAVFGALLAVLFWGRLLWNLNAPYASLYTVAFAPAAVLLGIVAERRDSPAGLVAAGLAAGSLVLFKQSLACFLVLGIALALWAVGMLREAPHPTRARLETRLALGAWAALAVGVLLPIRDFLSPGQYVLHVLPIHALMLATALAVLGRGATGSLVRVFARRLLPFGAGVATVLGLVVLLFAGMGALGALLDDMFVLPMTLTNYARPVHLPPTHLVAAVGGVAAAVGVGLLLVMGMRREAGILAGVGAVALGVAASGNWSGPLAWFTEGPALFAGLQPAAIAWAGLATVNPALQAGRLPDGAGGAAWLTLLFFHVFLAFQGFPRAGPDLFIAQGAQVVLLVAVLARWHRSIAAGRGRGTRVAVALLLGLLPAWLVVSPASSAVRAARSPDAFRELRLPRAAGVSLSIAEHRRHHVDDMERLVERLAAEPAHAPLLLLTNDEVVLFASGRSPLVPAQRAHLFWIAWGIGSVRGLDALEGEVLARLERTPEALVVDTGGPATRRVYDALPRLAPHLEAHYRPLDRVGRYRIRTRRAEPVP